jgi:hypothetical protein
MKWNSSQHPVSAGTIGRDFTLKMATVKISEISAMQHVYPVPLTRNWIYWLTAIGLLCPVKFKLKTVILR